MVLRIAGARPVLRAGLLQQPLSATTATSLQRFYSSSSSTSTVKLNYDLHEAEKPVSNDPNHESPILFLHGLFGSKRNNRAISK